MKLLKTKTPTGTLKDRFHVGQRIAWMVNTFDGRHHGRAHYTGDVVKVNRVTVDVVLKNGQQYRLDAQDLITAI